MLCYIHAYKSLQWRSKKRKRMSLRMKEWEMRRRDIFDLTSQQGVWRGWRQLMICTFCQILPGSFAQNGAAVAISPMHKQTRNIHIKSEKKQKHTSCILISSPHTLGPSLLYSLSSQRHKDIFIFYKAQTLMKHWRHKYIFMNIHIWLLPPLLWHIIASLSDVVNINCHNAWKSALFWVVSDAFQW